MKCTSGILCRASTNTVSVRKWYLIGNKILKRKKKQTKKNKKKTVTKPVRGNVL